MCKDCWIKECNCDCLASDVSHRDSDGLNQCEQCGHGVLMPCSTCMENHYGDWDDENDCGCYCHAVEDESEEF